MRQRSWARSLRGQPRPLAPVIAACESRYLQIAMGTAATDSHTDANRTQPKEGDMMSPITNTPSHTMTEPARHTLNIRDLTAGEMQARVARYAELKCPPDRYPDSKLPGHERKNYLVVGKGLQMKDAKDPLSAIPVSEGFHLAYATMRPGNGPKLHNHDTNETFVAIKGTWRVTWGIANDQAIELHPLDVCSVPAFVPRTFVCLSTEPGEDEGLMMAIVAGDTPHSEFI
jgi:uncharacterized RmlC-like cupin family protein